MNEKVNINVEEVTNEEILSSVPRMLVDDLFNFKGNRKQRREKMREVKRMFKNESIFSTLLNEAVNRGYVQGGGSDTPNE